MNLFWLTEIKRRQVWQWKLKPQLVFFLDCPLIIFQCNFEAKLKRFCNNVRSNQTKCQFLIAIGWWTDCPFAGDINAAKHSILLSPICLIELEVIYKCLYVYEWRQAFLFYFLWLLSPLCIKGYFLLSFISTRDVIYGRSLSWLQCMNICYLLWNQIFWWVNWDSLRR